MWNTDFELIKKIMIKISKATIENLKGIKKVDQLSFVDDSYPIFALRQYLDISAKYFLVAKENNEIIGYTIGNLIEDTNQGWILSLGVHPNARGKNIGKYLTKKLVGRLEKNNCREILLTVHPKNSSAMKIYKKNGFIEVAKSDNYYLDNEERIIMKKICANQS